MLKVLKGRVLVEVPPPATVTVSGLAIPERAQDERAHRVAKVVAVGPGTRYVTEEGDVVTVPPAVSVGDWVIYQTTWHGYPIHVEGRDYRVLDDDQCAAIVDPDVDVEMVHL